jgi:hypothetical protein
MNRCVRLAFILLLLPFAARAQDSTTPAPPHQVWDQEIPVSSDTLDEEAYPSIVLREVPDSLIKEFKADKKLQYDKKKPAPKDYTFLTNLFMRLALFMQQFYWIFLALIVGILGFIIYRYLEANGYLIRSKKVIEDEMIVLSDEGLDLATYEKEIQSAITSGKLRMAVRLLYLQTLRLLSDKELIVFSKEKTNASYLQALSGTGWYKTFANLTLNYEYIWYGEVPVDEKQFEVIRGHFRQFMNNLGYNR